jgi:hypothetical protein
LQGRAPPPIPAAGHPKGSHLTPWILAAAVILLGLVTVLIVGTNIVQKLTGSSHPASKATESKKGL